MILLQMNALQTCNEKWVTAHLRTARPGGPGHTWDAGDTLALGTLGQAANAVAEPRLPGTPGAPGTPARAPGQPRGEHGELLQSCGWSAARATESFWLEEPLKIIGSNRNTAPARTHVLRTSSTSLPNPPGMGTPPVWIGKAFSPEAAALRRGCISILKGFLDLGG